MLCTSTVAPTRFTRTSAVAHTAPSRSAALRRNVGSTQRLLLGALPLCRWSGSDRRLSPSVLFPTCRQDCKKLGDRCCPLLAPRYVDIPYGMTQFSTNTVAMLANVTIVTAMALNSFVYRSVKTTRG